MPILRKKQPGVFNDGQVPLPTIDKLGEIPANYWQGLSTDIGKWIHHPDRLGKNIHVVGLNKLILFYGVSNTLSTLTQSLGYWGYTGITACPREHDYKEDIVLRTFDANHAQADTPVVINVSDLLNELDLPEKILIKFKECLDTLK
ncbi:hypothetical protein GR11A_00224 [Vibrio phage vB_VcorM_GR11A]|nr:hypothetical protein GR11A_00224 [Vibrio phage vB_VcorM_GR11A]